MANKKEKKKFRGKSRAKATFGVLGRSIIAIFTSALLVFVVTAAVALMSCMCEGCGFGECSYKIEKYYLFAGEIPSLLLYFAIVYVIKFISIIADARSDVRLYKNDQREADEESKLEDISAAFTRIVDFQAQKTNDILASRNQANSLMTLALTNDSDLVSEQTKISAMLTELDNTLASIDKGEGNA